MVRMFDPPVSPSSPSAAVAAMSSSSGAAVAAAVASSSEVEGDACSVTCPLCACTYKDPLQLPCDHALCEQCIKSWAEKSKEMEADSVASSIDLLGLTDDDVWFIYGDRPVARATAAPLPGRSIDLRERCSFCKGVETPKDDLIFCDRCNLCVHPGCYHIQHVPEGDEPWYCEPCTDAIEAGAAAPPTTSSSGSWRGGSDGKAASKGRDRATASAASSSSSSTSAARPSSKKRSGSAASASASGSSGPAPAKCHVCCNTSDRALRRVAGGGYVHLSCASFLDGPEFTMDTPVSNLGAIHPERFKLACLFCRGYGAAVQCSFKSCMTAYHVPCGLANGALFAIKSCPPAAGEGPDAETEVFRDNVCPFHRKHVRAVANAHDRRVVEAQRAAKRARKRRGGRAAVAHQHKISCPTCRKLVRVDLRAAHFSLRPATALAARAEAWRLAHPEEDEELMDIIAKYPNSRAHDGSSSSDDSDEEQSKTKARPTGAGAGAAAAAAASSSSRTVAASSTAAAAATAAPSTSSSSSRSRATAAAAAAPSRTSSRSSPARAARTASTSSSHRGAGVCVPSSVPLLPQLSPMGSSSQPAGPVSSLAPVERSVRSLRVQPEGMDDSILPSSASAAASISRATTAAAPAAAPLTPSKRKHVAPVSSRRVHVDLSSGAASPSGTHSPLRVRHAVRVDGEEEEEDGDMCDLMLVPPSPASSSSGSAMPSTSLRMVRSHSEPAPVASPVASADVDAAAAASPRELAFVPAAPAPSSVRAQPHPSSSSASRKRTAAARPASSVGMVAPALARAGGSSSRGGYDPQLNLEIDGLEIIECHVPAPLSFKRARVAAPSRMQTSGAAPPQQQASASDEGMDCGPSAATGASTPARSACIASASSAGAGAGAARVGASAKQRAESAATGADDMSIDGDGDGDDASDEVCVQSEALIRLESLDSYLKEQMMSGQFLPPNSVPTPAPAAAAASASAPPAPVALLSPGLRSHLHALRTALRLQQSLLPSSSLPKAQRDRVPLVVDSLDLLLHSLLKQYLPHGAPTRRSARNKTAVAQQIDNIVSLHIDPLLAIPVPP